MTSTPHVLVVGSIMQDLTLACAEFPRAGQTVVGRLLAGQGGKGSNQAIACGRLGVKTTFVGAMGRDAFATQVMRFYRREGIGCRIALKAGQPTGTAVILLNREGQNEIVIAPGANTQIAPADIPMKLIRGARVVVTQLESNLGTTAHVLRVARKAGVTTILNPAPMREDLPSAFLRDVDVLIPNETEFVAVISGLREAPRRFDEAALRRLSWERLHALCRGLGVPTVIVTLGSRGCFVSEPASFQFIPAYSGLQVVDTTGAGDAFCGGFAAGLVRHDRDVVAAARLGTAVAALSITKPGAAYSMPTNRDITRFLARSRRPKLAEDQTR